MGRGQPAHRYFGAAHRLLDAMAAELETRLPRVLVSFAVPETAIRGQTPSAYGRRAS